MASLTKPPSPQQIHSDSRRGWKQVGDEVRIPPIYGPFGEVVIPGKSVRGMRDFMRNTATWQEPQW